MDERGFVERLIEALPEAFEAEDREDFAEDPLTYLALAQAVFWLEDAADRDHAMRRFWTFIEAEALAGAGDEDLENLIMIECFEGIGWTKDVLDLLGPRTRVLLRKAEAELEPYNSQIGKPAERARGKKPRNRP